MFAKFKTDTFLSIAALLLFLAIIVVFYFARIEQTHLYELEKSSNHTKTVLLHSKDLLAELSKNEMATEGFAISGDTGYLQKRSQTIPAIQQHARALRESMADHPELKMQSDSLDILINKRLAYGDSLISIRKNAGLLKALEFIQQGYGGSHIGEIKKLLDQNDFTENTFLSDQNKESQKSLIWITEQFYIILIVALFLAAIFITVALRNLRNRRKTEELLQYNDALLSSITDAVISIDENLVIKKWNKGAETVYGWTEAEAVGQQIGKLLQSQYTTLNPEQIIREVKRGGSIQTEIYHTTKNFERVSVLSTSSAVLNNEGMFSEILIVNKDVTELRDLANTLEAKVIERTEDLNKITRLYAFISQLNELIVRTTDKESLFQSICELAVKYGRFRMAWIGLVEEPTGIVKHIAKAGHEEGYLSIIKEISIREDAAEGRGPTGTAIRKGGYYICQDVTTNPDLAPWRDEQLKRGYYSSMSIAIKKFGAPVGALTVYAPEPFFFGDSEIELIKEAAEYISFAIENIEKEEQRKITEAKLYESQALTQAFFDSSVDGILLTSPDGSIHSANRAACKMYQRTEEEIKTIGRNGVVDVNDPRLADFLKKRAEHGFAVAEFTQIRKDGTHFPARVSSSIFTDEHGKQYASLIVHDLSELVKSEKLIRDYQFALDQSSLVDISDCNGRILYANENFCRLAGYSQEELQNIDRRLLNAGHHPKSFFTELWQTVKSGKVWRGEIKEKSKTGDYFWVDTTIVPFTNSDGEVFQFLSIRSDITAKKNAEEKVNIANQQYETLLHATSDTIWDRDLLTNKITYNIGIQTMLGYDIDEIENLEKWWDENVHPDDYPKISALLETAFVNRQKVITAEYRFRCADGTYKYIYDRAIVIYNTQDVPVRIIGAMQDITYLKEEEQRTNKAIIDAQERERQQIGMELHDNVKQIIAASQINLEVAKNKLEQKEMLAEILKRVSLYLKDAIHELRRLSHQLAPTVDEDLELTDTISTIVTSMQFNEQCKVITKVDDRLHKKIMSSEVRTAIFRILQEQLTNIHKHAEPTEVLIDVNKTDKGILLKIEDNGKGFDMKQKKEGIGIENIRRRVLFLKGDITIQSAPGKGCKIEASIPL